MQKKLGLYLHIPFCLKKCNYCDFRSFTGKDEAEMNAYVQALKKELAAYHLKGGESALQLGAENSSSQDRYEVDSIFIGGGTPSILPAPLIGELMETIHAHFDVSEGAEITIESNPKTLTEEKLSAYRKAGINRLSIGCQSTENDVLAFMGRAHRSEDFFENFRLARACGFDNINVDLMFGVKGQTPESWRQTLRDVLALAPEHVSFYSLQIEEGTPFYELHKNTGCQTGDEVNREMYHEAIRLLKDAGYLHYEISNAAKPGCTCRHNLKYWSMDDYLGLGLSAHSYMGGVRFANTDSLKEYMENDPEPVWVHVNTRKESMSDCMFTGLRRLSGVSAKEFEQRFGETLEQAYGSIIEKYMQLGFLAYGGGQLAFTERGLDFTNMVLREMV